MASSLKYFRALPNKGAISSKLLEFLKSPENLFAQQEALMIMCLRYMRDYSDELIKYGKNICFSKKKHWYTRSQAFLLLGQVILPLKLVAYLKGKYDEEINIEIKRSMIVPLCQLGTAELKYFVREISFDPNPKIGRLGRMLLDLHTHRDVAREEINNLFHNYDEIRLMDNIYKIELIKIHSDSNIREMLRERLKMNRQKIKRPSLKYRVEKYLIFLGEEKNF
jgi:hypothetical protein